MNSPPLTVEVTRGDLVESVHHVAACALDASGKLLYDAGEIEVPVFLRSTAKPFIAAAAVEAGVVEQFGLEPREIAVMAASHTGEAFHLDAVASILEKLGMDETALQCGAHFPYDEAAAHALLRHGKEATALYNNCSGKHAGILALCKAIGADPATYLEATNPAQQRILAFCARLSDDDVATWPIAIDGCGIPTYATSLRRAALAFARLATLNGVDDRTAAALNTVREAMSAYPQYVSGTGQFDTVLMAQTGGTLVAKGGAEGVMGVAAVVHGSGYAGKVLDGAGRARPPSTIAVLARIGALESIKPELDRFARPAVYNRAGRTVGEIRAIV